MRHGTRIAALLGSALTLSASVALGQVKTTNQGVSDTEVLVGTHQVLTGPGSAWGVPVANGMKMAVEEINAAGTVANLSSSLKTVAMIQSARCL
jgi:branched-chain amino acid transport system substrate-binding protein